MSLATVMLRNGKHGITRKVLHADDSERYPVLRVSFPGPDGSSEAHVDSPQRAADHEYPPCHIHLPTSELPWN